jgi:hypothetical protein
MSDSLINYSVACPVLSEFHNDKSLVRIVRGPRGSTKSTACQMELFKLALEMPAQADGVRRSRMLIVRSSYRAMEMSALASHKVLFSKMKGWSGSEIAVGREPWRTTFKVPMPDGTRVESEWVWLAFDEMSFDKLRSVEATCIYVNESAHDFIDCRVFTKCIESLGRYPAKSGFSQEVIGASEKSGRPIYRAALIADFNPPNEMHEIRRFEDNPPVNWRFFVQPAPLIETPEDQFEGDKTHTVTKDGFVYSQNPDCSYVRVHNAGVGYYFDMLGGADRGTIDSSVLGKYSRSIAGKPVYPMFNEDSVRKNRLDHSTYGAWPLVIGCDTSGHHPAAIIGGVSGGTLYLLDEIYQPDVSFEQFLEDELIPVLSQKYSQNRVIAVLDPSNPADAISKRTALMIMQKAGIPAVLAHTNNVQDRISAVNHYVVKRGGLSVGGHMEHTLLGLRGGYRYESVRGMVGIYKNSPSKDKNSHLMDALQYLALHVRKTLMQPKSEPITLKARVRRPA